MPSSFVIQHPTNFTLHLPIADLRSAEDVRLDLDVALALRIVDPVRFDIQFARLDGDLDEQRLAGLLAETARTELAPLFRTLPLAELDANPRLRDWLGTAVEHALRTEADLAGRSGLEVLGVDAYDLRCQVLDELRDTRQTLYLRASLAEAEAAGRLLLDERVLAELTAHLSVKEDLVQRQETLATLEEREAQALNRQHAARAGRRDQERQLFDAMRTPPSILRPELWRHDLGGPTAAPLFHEDRVYVATHAGQVQAFDAQTGEPVWEQPAALPTRPGDGLACAAGSLWIPGHDGILYRLDAQSGAARPPVAIGGKLSAAPLVAGDWLYLSVDVDPLAQRPGYGHVALVDPAAGVVVHSWPVTTTAGLRAQPALDGKTLVVGDRKGVVYLLNIVTGRVESAPARLSKVLGAALPDPGRSQFILGDGGHPLVVALSRAGQQRWRRQLGGVVVGQPLMTDHGLAVAASDGKLYWLDPANGQQLRPPFETRGPIATSPVAWEGLVFVGSRDGYLYAIDAASGKQFWRYYSGGPIIQTPAIAPDGRLFVVDEAGRLSALRWCLASYAEGARRLQTARSSRWEQVIELWLAAGEAAAALETARAANRPDLAAELALGLGLYRQAAQTFETLARRPGAGATRGARWWHEAARAWLLADEPARAETCRLQDARNRGAPLLGLSAADQPLLLYREAGQVQVLVRNLTDVLARDVVLRYTGHVKQAGELRIGSLDAYQEEIRAIEIVPTESGSASLRVTAHYDDGHGRSQLPVYLDIRLKVAQPPVVIHHGPYIGGDGVIIMRGGAGAGRTLHVQSDDDSLTIDR